MNHLPFGEKELQRTALNVVQGSEEVNLVAQRGAFLMETSIRQPAWRRNYRPPHPDAVVLTIQQFCVRYNISQQKLHLLWAERAGPRRTMVGRAVRIGIQDAEDWHHRRIPGHGYD